MAKALDVIKLKTYLLVTGLLLTVAMTAEGDRSYEDALVQIQNQQFSFESLDEWQGHLLHPHLVTHWVIHNLGETDAPWFAQFIGDENHQAAVWQVREPWLAELARRELWSDYLALTSDLGLTPDPCHRLTALENTGHEITAADLRSLWLTSRSLPEHCDPLLPRVLALPDADELVWQRQLLAFKSRNAGLVSHLAGRYSTSDMARRGKRLHEVYQNPAVLLSSPYHPGEEWQRTLALATVDRMAYLDPEKASDLWVQVIRATPQLKRNQVQAVSSHLGEAMAKLALPQADYWLYLADPEQSNNDLQHWRLQIALAGGNWHRVIELSESVAPAVAGEEKWTYWRAVAERELGYEESSLRLLSTLADRRSYYGFLAAQAMGRPVSLNADITADLDLEASSLLSLNGIQRARALFQAGDIERAQLEWNLALAGLSHDQLLEAAQLAHSWNWHHKASQSASRSGRYGELTLRYPTPWLDTVLSLEALHQVPRYWIYGVIRQESHFMTHAISRVGARGLMQLMPYTAREIASSYDLPYRLETELNNPDLNLELGTRYLSMMMGRFNDPVLATAAYNAGPSRVDSWVKRYPLDRRVWIESIPFEETRGYVKSVLTYAQIYASRDQLDWSMAQWLDDTGLILSDGSATTENGTVAYSDDG